MSTFKLVATVIYASALSAAITAWAVKLSATDQTLTTPPLLFQEEQDDLLILGSWNTIQGYAEPYTIVTEIRCSKVQMSCIEGMGRILNHYEGQDLESETYGYKVEDWNETNISTVATRLMADCLERRMNIDLENQTATVTWAPSSTCDGGDTGKAILIGEKIEDV